MDRPVIFLSAVSAEFRDLRQLLHDSFKTHFHVITQDDTLHPFPGGDVRQLLSDAIDGSHAVLHLAGAGFGSTAAAPFPEMPGFLCSWTQYEYYYAHSFDADPVHRKQIFAIVCGPTLRSPSFTEKDDATLTAAQKAPLQEAHCQRIFSGKFDDTPLANTPRTFNHGKPIDNNADALRAAIDICGQLAKAQPALKEACALVSNSLEAQLIPLLQKMDGKLDHISENLKELTAAQKTTDTLSRNQLQAASELKLATDLAAADLSANSADRKRLREAARSNYLDRQRDINTQFLVHRRPGHSARRFQIVCSVIVIALIAGSLLFMEKTAKVTPGEEGRLESVDLDLASAVRQNSWRLVNSPPGSLGTSLFDDTFSEGAVWTFSSDGTLNVGKLVPGTQRYDESLLSGTETYRWTIEKSEMVLIDHYGKKGVLYRFNMSFDGVNRITLSLPEKTSTLHLDLQKRVGEEWRANSETNRLGPLIGITILWLVPGCGLLVSRLWGSRSRKIAFWHGAWCGFIVPTSLAIFVGALGAFVGAFEYDDKVEKFFNIHPLEFLMTFGVVGIIWGIASGLIVGVLRATLLWPSPADIGDDASHSRSLDELPLAIEVKT